jgi:hypothetical protein
MLQLLIWVLMIGVGVFLLKRLIDVLPWIDADFKKIGTYLVVVVGVIWALSLIAAAFGFSLWPDTPWHPVPRR